jgi:hypothetical protein
LNQPCRRSDCRTGARALRILVPALIIFELRPAVMLLPFKRLRFAHDGAGLHFFERKPFHSLMSGPFMEAKSFGNIS